MIKIIADTTAALPSRFVEEHNLPVLPQIVIFGDESYRDDTEMDTQTFMARLCTSTALPKTAAPPPALYHPLYEKYLAEGHSILVIAPTSEASGTLRSALTAAKDFPGADIQVFDSRTVAGPQGTMTMRAVEWAEAGLDMENLLSRLRSLVNRQRFYIYLDTLEFLHRGGRIGGAQHMVGSLLQVKPLLTIRDGRVEAHSQTRTKRRALECLKELVLTECPRGEEDNLCVMHAGAEQDARELADFFAEQIQVSDIPVYLVPPAIAVHTGPRALGTGFFVKD